MAFEVVLSQDVTIRMVNVCFEEVPSLLYHLCSEKSLMRSHADV